MTQPRAGESCEARRDDLALAAGGDLEPRAERALHEHVASCAACAALLDALEADQGVMARLRTVEPPSEGLAVAATARLRPRVETAHGRRTAGSARGTRFPAAGRAGAWRAAAAVAVLAVAGWTALDVVERGEEPTFTAPIASNVAQTASPAASGGIESEAAAADVKRTTDGDASSFLPVEVRRAAGGTIELHWPADGRERDGRLPAYRVLASASAASFDAATAIDVAGNHLVANAALPAGRIAAGTERKVTYFRVQ